MCPLAFKWHETFFSVRHKTVVPQNRRRSYLVFVYAGVRSLGFLVSCLNPALALALCFSVFFTSLCLLYVRCGWDAGLFASVAFIREAFICALAHDRIFDLPPRQNLHYANPSRCPSQSFFCYVEPFTKCSGYLESGPMGGAVLLNGLAQLKVWVSLFFPSEC